MHISPVTLNIFEISRNKVDVLESVSRNQIRACISILFTLKGNLLIQFNLNLINY